MEGDVFFTFQALCDEFVFSFIQGGKGDPGTVGDTGQKGTKVRDGPHPVKSPSLEILKKLSEHGPSQPGLHGPA